MGAQLGGAGCGEACVQFIGLFKDFEEPERVYFLCDSGYDGGTLEYVSAPKVMNTENAAVHTIHEAHHWHSLCSV